MEIAEKNGNYLYVNSVRSYLIADYAHLGHFSEMKSELGLFHEDYASTFNESIALCEKLVDLQDDVSSLLAQYESQSEQIETLQAQRNQYRLAFFGLLAMVIATLVLLMACKIVRKNRPIN